jgi:hypothetical protein
MQSSEHVPHASSPEQSRPERANAGAPGVEEEATPWVTHGILSGVIGAFVVATFFLVVDLLAGRPFYTPMALGSAFFTGEAAGPAAAIEPAIVAGYTAIHGLVFVAVGLFAAYWLTNARRRPTLAGGVGMGVVLFLAFEVLFAAYTSVLAPGLLAQFGIGKVALANLIAAGGMAAYLLTQAVPEP